MAFEGARRLGTRKKGNGVERAASDADFTVSGVCLNDRLVWIICSNRARRNWETQGGLLPHALHGYLLKLIHLHAAFRRNLYMYT